MKTPRMRLLRHARSFWFFSPLRRIRTLALSLLSSATAKPHSPFFLPTKWVPKEMTQILLCLNPANSNATCVKLSPASKTIALGYSTTFPTFRPSIPLFPSNPNFNLPSRASKTKRNVHLTPEFQPLIPLLKTRFGLGLLKLRRPLAHMPGLLSPCRRKPSKSGWLVFLFMPSAMRLRNSSWFLVLRLQNLWDFFALIRRMQKRCLGILEQWILQRRTAPKWWPLPWIKWVLLISALFGVDKNFSCFQPNFVGCFRRFFSFMLMGWPSDWFLSALRWKTLWV